MFQYLTVFKKRISKKSGGRFFKQEIFKFDLEKKGKKITF